MKYNKIVSGIFIDRPNRFIAHVEIKGVVETVHVKNTGRCKELLIPGVTVILEDCLSETRKTRYDLIAVYKKGFGLINIDSQAPNKIVEEWLRIQNFDYIKPEYSFGNSRLDFYMEKEGEKFLLEIKGCTLEVNGTGYFPDAPTSRGVKHLNELARAASIGYRCIVGFVIQMEKIDKVLPNFEMDPEFGKALDAAIEAGVNVLFLKCKVSDNSLVISEDNKFIS